MVRAAMSSHPPPEQTPWGPIGTWANMLLVDHGIFRTFYNTRSRVSPRMWRSSQPWPYQLRAAAEAGVKTVINLRGRRRCGAYYLEVATCQALGLTLIDAPIGSREAPRRDRVLTALDLFDSIAYPALMHCKSGADRAGFMAALFLLTAEGRPLAEAMGQLSWRYGHIKAAKTGILDAFFAAYAAYAAGPAPRPFRDWVTEIYDPAALSAGFKADWWANRVTDTLLRRE